MAMVLKPAAPAQTRLVDAHGRVMRKLRVSLLDACNFRCFYCMPIQARFARAASYLPPAELGRICAVLVGAGIEEIRVTGGEPTIRPDFAAVMHELGRLPLRKLGLTSNGLKLRQYLPLLSQAGCRHLNLSLDSLDPGTFRRITRFDGFHEVMAALLQARELGFRVKLNTVVIKGVNEHELMDFVRFAESTGIEVRFLELMRIGQALPIQDQGFVPASEILACLGRERHLSPLPGRGDDTARRFRSDGGGLIGLIASESEPFCQSCSRLRLGFDGRLRPCLMIDQGRSLSGLSEPDLLAATREVMAQKPYQRLAEVQQDMNQIGG